MFSYLICFVFLYTVQGHATCHGENEYYSCGSSCDNVCATLHEMNQTNCPYVNIRCNDLCYCKEGYARDGDNKCIPIQDCPEACPPNEEYVKCKPCPPDLCISLVAKFKCDSKACSPGCVCKPNYLRRNDSSPCMPTRECPELANSPDFNK